MLRLAPFTEREIRTAVNTTVRLIETAPTKVPPPASSRLPESSKERSVAKVASKPAQAGIDPRNPIAKTNAEVLRYSDALDAGGEIRGQQARIGGLIREAPDGCESAVDRARRLTRFQMDSVAGDNSFVERQSWFGAIPCDELVDSVPIPSLGFFRGQAIESRRSCLIEVWKAQSVLAEDFLT